MGETMAVAGQRREQGRPAMGGGLRLWGKTAFAVMATLSTVLIVGWFIGRLDEATMAKTSGMSRIGSVSR